MNTTPDTITELPLEQLHESPFNQRQRFAVDDLAASIRSEGRVLEPLLVRPRIFAQGLARRADGLRDDDDTQDGFEIVFGHRRLRAAEAAGLATVPCMVRALTDAQARSAQIAENLERDDVHPLEEAASFRALVDDDGLTPDQIAERYGKSRSYVYGRLKLLHLHPEVRAACLAGDVGAEVALLLALDGAWRSGANPKEIAFAIASKQLQNEARTWPDWRPAAPGKAIEHDRSAE